MLAAVGAVHAPEPEMRNGEDSNLKRDVLTLFLPDNRNSLTQAGETSENVQLPFALIHASHEAGRLANLCKYKTIMSSFVDRELSPSGELGKLERLFLTFS